MPTKSLDSRAQFPVAVSRNGLHLTIRASTLAAFSVFAMLSILSTSLAAQEVDQTQLAYVDPPPIDPCPARGEIHGLDPRGDGFLAVRNGSSTEHEQIDELHNGDVVSLCDYKNGWHGIVYPGEGQDPAECLADPTQTANPEPYRGPCKSGWVHGNWVRRMTS